ncbi:MAG: hypothetical protein AAB893_03980 [Patescibacteria group bacterium]
MSSLKQVQLIFSNLFKLAGFKESEQSVMTDEILHVWLVKTTIKISNTFLEDQISQINKLFKTADDLKKKENLNLFLDLISKMNPNQKEKVVDILFDEAFVLFERMAKKFFISATEEQKNKLKSSLETILKN